MHEGGFDVRRLDDGAFRFTNPHGLTIKPTHPQEPSSPDIIVIQNESLGLAIDCETATPDKGTRGQAPHWHGERIDYDHALMVTMASWDSGDTRPEAGPAAGDWNPSQVNSGSGFQSGCDTGVASRSFVQPTRRVDAVDPLEQFDAAQGAGGRGCRQAGRGMFRGTCSAIGRRGTGFSFVISY